MKNYLRSLAATTVITFAIYAIVSGPVRAAAISNTVQYCDELSDQCFPFPSTTVTNSTPIAISGQYGGASSTLTYDTFTGQVTSTGYNTPVSAAGSQGAVSAVASDSITFGGGSGIGYGVAIMTLGDVTTTPGTVIYSAPGVGNNPLGYGSSLQITLALGSPYVWPGGGFSGNYYQDWLSTSTPQLFTTVSCSTSSTCSYNSATGQLIVPFDFVYGVAGTLQSSFFLNSTYGALAQLNASLSFELPTGATIEADSGTGYVVETSPVPLPSAAWLMLSGLVVLRAVCGRETRSRPNARSTPPRFHVTGGTGGLGSHPVF